MDVQDCKFIYTGEIMMNKMLAKKMTASVVLGAALSVLATGVATAHTVVNEGYVIDAQGNVVRDGFGDCVKTGYWTLAMANATCDASLVKKPAPAPAPVVVAPAPAPVVEAPAPVVVAPVVVAPPPPPPAPVFKTVVTEKALTLSGTSFDTGSAKLKKSATAKLEEAVSFANENKDSDLVVSGFTDSRGSEAKNVKLSAARAEAVKAYLVKKGVAASRLTSKGMGSANPVGDNKTKAGQDANRRVEIHTTVKQETKVRVN
jgi:OOP family OmpA-OmpF porin